MLQSSPGQKRSTALQFYDLCFFFTALWRLCSSSEAKKDGFLRAFLKEALGSFVQHVKHDLAFCNLAL